MRIYPIRIPSIPFKKPKKFTPILNQEKHPIVKQDEEKIKIEIKDNIKVLEPKKDENNK